MTHYHVITATNVDTAIASVKYDNYEDSLEQWVKLSTRFFGHIGKELGGLQIEHAKAATNNGAGYMARAGSQTLCFYWMRCEDACFSITWN